MRIVNKIRLSVYETEFMVCSKFNTCMENGFVFLGSLYHYLHENQPLEVGSVLKLLSTAAAGLEHLHSKVRAIPNKPAIAHRDVKVWIVYQTF